MKILVIDNYDSFTYNLVYILKEAHSEVVVFRNDKITPEDCLQYDAIVLSPGPGIPKDAGNLMQIIQFCAGKIPIIGVCLGHQAIAQYLGANLRQLDQVFHGIQNDMYLTSSQSPLFTNFSTSFQAGRYHSWIVELTEKSNFEVTAVTEDQSIMAIQNLELKLYGIQFHPESILTPKGAQIIINFIEHFKLTYA